jgi:hypothetical protein
MIRPTVLSAEATSSASVIIPSSEEPPNCRWRALAQYSQRTRGNSWPRLRQVTVVGRPHKYSMNHLFRCFGLQARTPIKMAVGEKPGGGGGTDFVTRTGSKLYVFERD